MLISCNSSKDSSTKNDPVLNIVDNNQNSVAPFGSLPGTINLYGTSVPSSEFLVKVLNETKCFNGKEVREYVETELIDEEVDIQPSSIYVGVTSYGDVGAVIKGSDGKTIIVGSVCKRSTSVQDATITTLTLGTQSNCVVKPISEIVVEFTDGTLATFRPLDQGNTENEKYSFCKPASVSDASDCDIYPWNYGCASTSYNSYTTGTQGTSTGSVTENYTTSGSYTSGGYTGGSTGGTSTGGSTGSTPYEQNNYNEYSSLIGNNNWQSLYPNGLPPENCSSPTGEGYDLRQGTITVAGQMMYAPNNPWNTLGDQQYSSISYTHNVSSYLTKISTSRQFLATDARLKLRFKIRPQPSASNQGTWCLGRQTGFASDSFGYMNLKFAVSLKALNADGELESTFINTKYVSARVNSCTPALDFSGITQNHPYGVVFVVHDVQSCSTSSCETYGQIRTSSCWQMDVQASVDSTKDIQ